MIKNLPADTTCFKVKKDDLLAHWQNLDNSSPAPESNLKMRPLFSNQYKAKAYGKFNKFWEDYVEEFIFNDDTPSEPSSGESNLALKETVNHLALADKKSIL